MPEDTMAETEASLRSMGAQADAAGESLSEHSVSDEPESPSETATATTPTTPSEDQVNTPAEGEATAKPQSAETAAEKTVPDKPPSEYEKAKAAKRDREAAAWQKIEAEKEAVRLERQKLEHERQQTQPQQYRSDEYAAAAEKAEQAAKDAELYDPEEARQHAENAKAFRAQAQRVWQAERNAALTATLLESSKKMGVDKELEDPNSENGKKFKSILESAPEIFYGHPKAPALAVALYVAQKDAATVPALKAKLEALTKENDRLTKATSLPRSGPAKVTSTHSNGERTEVDLLRMAAEMDAEMPA